MDEQTSIGPTETRPGADPRGKKAPAVIDGVDAQSANQDDMRRGLAGVEGKPFSEKAVRVDEAEQARQATRQSDHEAPSSEPPHDPNAGDPNSRDDLTSERRSLGLHSGDVDPGGKASR